MEPNLSDNKSSVFVLGFEQFSIYYLADTNQVVSRLDVQDTAESSRKTSAQEKNS